MPVNIFKLKAPLFWLRFLLKSLCHAHFLLRRITCPQESESKFQKYSCFSHKQGEPLDATLIFHMEEALLKSSSLFPYFMLVAYEAGGLIRALVLFLSYPFVCLFSKEIGIKIMVLTCFCGIKKANYRLGRSVLPKFFLEDVGCEGFQVVMKYKKKVAVSDMPNVMVEGFLRDCLDVKAVVGRDLKVVLGYYVGLMEEKRDLNIVMNEIIGQENMNPLLVGFGSANKCLNQQIFPHCKVGGTRSHVKMFSLIIILKFL